MLNECNDQKVPPREFKEMFCKRCRNQTCANAGWSSSPSTSGFVPRWTGY